jgi:secreted PhoX family phosphatase
VLSGVDNVTTSQPGVVYVAEDGGNMQIVLVREDGRTFPVVELPAVRGSEITGPAFDPSGTRLYFSSQRNPGTTYEVSGPWPAFTTS